MSWGLSDASRIGMTVELPGKIVGVEAGHPPQRATFHDFTIVLSDNISYVLGMIITILNTDLELQ